MNNNRVIGIELVVDDQGTVKLIKFADSAKQAFGQAEQSAEGLDKAMKKGGQQAKSAEGAMEQVERRAGSLSSRIKLMGGGFDRLRETGKIAFDHLYRSGKRAFDHLYRSGKSAFDRLHRAGSVFWNTTRRITSGIFSLQGALVGLGLGLVAKSFLDVSRETENYHTRLSTLLGSQQKATAAMQYFQEVASGVPFTLRDVVESGTALEAFGANSKEWLTPLTDLAAVMGIELPEAAQALGRAYAGGAGAADIFRERGILQIIKDAAKMKAGIEDITKLTLPAFRQLMLLTFTDPDGKIAGASTGLAKNWDGMLSMLSDKWFQFRQKMMGAGVFDLLKSQLQRLLDALDTHKDTIAKWAERAGKAVEGLLQKGVNFIQNIVDNWGAWEARWEKFKSGASEVWTQTKNVASAVGSLLKVALDGWNNLPPVVREFGLVGALIGGVKGKLIFSAIVGLSALLDKAKEFSKGEPDLHIGGVTVPGSPERGYLFKFRQWLEEQKGQKPTKSLRELNAGYYRKDYPTGPMGGDMGGATAQGLADLGIPEPVLPAATSAAGTSPGKTTPNRFTVPTGDDEKALAKREAAGLKAVKEYMAAVEEANKLEVSLRHETMTSYERSFDDLERGYTATYDKIEDLEYRGAITSEQALDMRRQASSNYLTARDKMEADHNLGLLRKIEEFGKSGRELQQLQLQYEIEDLQKAGYDKELIRQYTAQRMYEIDKSMLVKTLEAWTNTDQLIADGAKNLMDGLQQEWTGFFTKVFDNGLSNIEDSFGDFCDAVFSMWKQMLAQFVAQWTLSGFASIMLGLINLLKGGEFTFNLNGGGGSGGIVGTVATGVASTGIWSGVKSGAAYLAGALGMDSVAAWLGGTAAEAAISEAAVAAATQSASEMAAAYGAMAAGEFAGTGAAAGAAQSAFAAYGGTMAGGEFAGAATTAATTSATSATTGTASLAGLGATLTPMGIALGLGTAGMLLHQMGFLMDGPRSKEEAIDRWTGGSEGQGGEAAYLEEMARQVAGGGTASGVGGQDAGFYSQAAQDAYLAFEQLGTIAGYTKEQLDAVYNSLSPLARKLLDSGHAASNVDEKIHAMAQRIAYARDTMDWTSDTINGLQGEINALGREFGLSGEEADKFSRKVWDMSQDMHHMSGQTIQAGDAVTDLADDVRAAMGGIANSADGIVAMTSATGALADAMGDLADQANKASSATDGIKGGLGVGGGNSVPAYHQGGLVRHSGGGIGNWGWVGYEELMRLAGDEVLTKLRLGEYVVQAGAVNSLTGPWLDQLNDTGQPPVLAAPVPVPMPVATSGQAGQGNRTVNIQAGAVTVVVQGGDMDEDALALRLRDRLAEMARDAFEAV